MYNFKTVALTAVALLVASCTSMAPKADYGALVKKMMDSSFRDEGIAKTDRLIQDEANAACSQAQNGSPPEEITASIQQAALKSVRMPADGKFTGDWREGEKLAQNGRGMTWSDKSALPKDNGGNCLNCHQVTKEEVSYGTIGPSLYHYGKTAAFSTPRARSLVQ